MAILHCSESVIPFYSKHCFGHLWPAMLPSLLSLLKTTTPILGDSRSEEEGDPPEGACSLQGPLQGRGGEQRGPFM